MKSNHTAFTLIEVIVASAVFAIVAFVAYGIFANSLRLVQINQDRLLALDVANEAIEQIRNLSYSDIGVVSGIPNGVVPLNRTVTRDGQEFTVTHAIRNIDDPYDGTFGGSFNDSSPADSKLVAVTVNCDSCPQFKPIELTARVAPDGLETASDNGALFVQVFDANGLPVEGATVQIDNVELTPEIHITDTTGVDGFLKIIDVPPATSSYQIAVTKNGYSFQQTYAAADFSPSVPSRPDTTVALQNKTVQSFAIDQLATINFNTLDSVCSPIGNVSFDLTSSKLVATGPDVKKYDQTLSTNASGNRNSVDLEWDTYSVDLGSTSYELRGSNPTSLLSVLPGVDQSVDLILGTKNPNTIVVTAKDVVTGGPISNVTVDLMFAGSVIKTKTTGRGSFTQTDWSGGSGQNSAGQTDKYFSSTNIEIDEPVGDLSLREVISGQYATSGVLESSIFDTGAVSTFHALTFSPTNQPVATGVDSVRWQLATSTAADPTITPEVEDDFVYLGPDGTAGSYFTADNPDASNVHDGDRYWRYKLFLETDDNSVTPFVSDVSMTYTSSCTPPGQVFFNGLATGEYEILLDDGLGKTGSESVDLQSAWQTVEANISEIE